MPNYQMTSGGGGGGGGGNVTWATSAQFTSAATCPFHHLEEIEYVNGDVVGRCKDCGISVFIPEVPGGVLSLRIREMLERLATDDLAGELIATYASLRAALIEERRALEEAEARLVPIQALLEQHGLF